MATCDLSCGMWFPDQESNPGPLHWEFGVLATFIYHQGSPNKSSFFIVLVETSYCCCYCSVTSVVSDSVRPHPWDSPGKNTGVGCHFLLQCIKVKSESEVSQSCLTLRNPMDCSLPGSSVHEIFQVRDLIQILKKILVLKIFYSSQIFLYVYKTIIWFWKAPQLVFTLVLNPEEKVQSLLKARWTSWWAGCACKQPHTFKKIKDSAISVAWWA